MSITVINLWPAWQTCQRCGKYTQSNRCWPYYEEFLHPDDANSEGGHVPVCGECFCWLEDNASALWLREKAMTQGCHHQTEEPVKTQDPKYDIENGRLVNAVTREPIPMDEPIFILRAKDVNAAPTISAYLGCCRNHDHRISVGKRLAEFAEFAATHPERMKEPDTAPSRPSRPTEHFQGHEPTGA